MKIAPSLIAAGLATALTGSLWADESSEKSTAQAQHAPSSNLALSEAQAQEFFRASDLVGKKTQTQDGQSAGEIKEIIFNQKGQIFALVNVGNDRWAVVPWQLANAATAKGSQDLVLNTTADQLKHAPAVTKTQWGSVNNPRFTQGIYTYFHLPEGTAMGGGGEQGATGQSQGQGTSGEAQPSQPSPK